jgi:fructose-bisphosphate aldolase class I
MNDEQRERMRDGKGFIAALDQSGGSTPKALAAYGIGEDRYHSEAEMFDLVHEMRTRVITSPAFTSEHILAAILFTQTMRRQIDGVDTADYLWERKHIVPFLKVDEGLMDAADGVQLMKPIPDLPQLLDEAVRRRIFGTKARSVIAANDAKGIQAIVDQQFALARQIGDAGLVPIIEPEIDIHAADKASVEETFRATVLDALDARPGYEVMLKVTLPERDDWYAPLIEHPGVLRVVALSGGYSREEADARLARNHGLIASFSRALLDGLDAGQTQAQFDATLTESVAEIYRASTSGGDG